jgi:hypothetical protein
MSRDGAEPLEAADDSEPVRKTARREKPDLQSGEDVAKMNDQMHKLKINPAFEAGICKVQEIRK